MFIDHIVAVVVFIYDTLVKLMALSTPVLAVISLPVSSSIMDSVYSILGQKDSDRIAFELKKISKRLALLLLPFAFGIFAISNLLLTHTPSVQPVAIKYLEKFNLGGMLVFIFLPAAIRAFKSLLAGKSGAAGQAAIWFGVLWFLLYAQLGLLFLIYLA